MKKSEIIIIITIVVLAISAIVVGVFAFKGSEEKISSGENKIEEFFSELFEKKEKDEDPDPVAPATTDEPDETEVPEDDDDDETYEDPDYDIYEDNEFFEYDERGNIIRENYGDYYIINQYDENNLKVLSLTHNSDDKVIKTTEYIYDENNNLIRKNNFDELGKHTDYIEYEYNEDGSHTESGYLSNGILIDKTLFDKSGFIVRSEYYYKNYLAQLYEFDPETFCAKQTNYDEDGNITYYAEYDENGDLVKEETYD